MPSVRSATKVRPGRLRSRPQILPLECRLAPAIISGAVFFDSDGSGTRDPGEPGMPGVTVFLDTNNNGQFDPPAGGQIGDPAAKTALDGKYTIQTLFNGTASVLQVVPTGFVQSTPGAPPLTIDPTQNYKGPEFGNKLAGPMQGGTIRGLVFNDVNGDGVQASSEPGLGSVLVFIDVNGNNTFDPPTPTLPGEPATPTNTNGNYELKVPIDGSFAVRAVSPTNSKQTTPTPADVKVNGGQLVQGPAFGFQQNVVPTGGLIRGHVFLDLDGDGVRDNNEPGQPGVVVFIDGNANGKFDPPAGGQIGDPFVMSGQNGGYELKVSFDGKFDVGEVVPPGFVATTPIMANVSVSGGAVAAGPDFGNRQSTPPPGGGTIRGHVFIDLDGNGQQSTNEPGQPGVLVFLDINNNGKFDPPPAPGTIGEPATQSGLAGGYEFKVGKDGDFVVAEIVPPGFVATTPTSGKVTVAGGATVSGPNFGNNKAPAAGGLIRGHVFFDANGDGKRQNTEPGIPGVTVYLDLNGNGKLDPSPSPTTPGEPATKTNFFGGYEFKVGKDGDYQVAEIVPAGLAPTTPTSGKVTVTGGSVVNGPEFGLNKAPLTGGRIRGHVFIDLNGDGQRQNNEPGQPNVVVFIDLNGNGKFDAPTLGTAGEPATKSDLGGRYELRIKADGDYQVLEVTPQGFTQTTPTPGKVSVSKGATVNGPDFGNQPNVTVQLGAVTGRVFVDGNNNGKLDPNEPGMPGVRVYDDANTNGKFDAGERFTFSGFNGRYFLILSAGNHDLRQVVPAGFVETAGPGQVTIVGGQLLTGANFGNRPAPSPSPGSGGFAPLSSSEEDDLPLLSPAVLPPTSLEFLGGIAVP